ncbi:MAG: UDP-N-acetylglucosamine 2-epimerase (non-hydrolyzing) [Bacteroidota bacterium]
MSQIKILTIIGARPQIIKAAALSRAIRTSYSDKIKEVIVHTGQHYDDNMSKVFFEELEIPEPNYNLNVGSGNHGSQTAAMLVGIEEILVHEKPNCIVLYGDTNSTLAGAIAASKIHIPVVHIEAGLRSFNKSMPEEINRIICDHISTILFTPTLAGLENLKKEGFQTNNLPPYSCDNPAVYHCGDVMLDNSLYFATVAEQRTTILRELKLEKENYILTTIHRNNNTDDPIRLNSLFSALNNIAKKNDTTIVVPLHPRTSKLLAKNLSISLYDEIKKNKKIKIISPVSFIEMIVLEKNSKLIMTDSGGVQKEAYFFKKPCIILRSETEWVELVACGSASVVDADERKIHESYYHFTQNIDLKYPQIFGNGRASEFICEKILLHIH